MPRRMTVEQDGNRFAVHVQDYLGAGDQECVTMNASAYRAAESMFWVDEFGDEVPVDDENAGLIAAMDSAVVSFLDLSAQFGAVNDGIEMAGVA